MERIIKKKKVWGKKGQIRRKYKRQGFFYRFAVKPQIGKRRNRANKNEIKIKGTRGENKKKAKKNEKKKKRKRKRVKLGGEIQ